jgi:LCP family protein required for cell wall assembly
MLSDDELINGLRAELANLCPPDDLLERLRADASAGRGRSDGPLRRWRLRTRSGATSLAGGYRRSHSVRAVVLIAAGILPAVVILLVALGTLGTTHHPMTHAAAGSLLDTKGGLHISNVVLPKPGAPQTLLLIASDHRAGEPYKTANTDTIMLVRLDADSTTNNVLEIPRGLKVQIPEGDTTVTGKLNSAYSVGGPSLVLSILKTQVFPRQDFRVNHVIDINFAGISDLIDAIGCVYADVDHRYYNNTALTNYSSIDIQPGYQKLCGDNQSNTGALAFMRFRHTDSEIVRNARQQDFIRWAKQSYTGAQIFTNRDKLLQVFGAHAQTDNTLHSASALESLMILIADSVGRALTSIPFPATFQPCNSGSRTPCYTTSTPKQNADAYRAFMTPTNAPVRSPALGTSNASGGNGRLVLDATAGQSQASTLRNPGLPVAYPTEIAPHSTYCSSATGNCDETTEPADEYATAYPRAYRIDAPNGRSYPAYRMTLEINRAQGLYYGVQGTTWKNPPILNAPTRTQQLAGKQLLEYYNGDQLSLVAWKTPTATYWISNTLTDSIPNNQLIAIAASLRIAT